MCCPPCNDLTPSLPSGATYMEALPDSDVLNSEATGDQSPHKLEIGVTNKFCDGCMKEEKAMAACLECQLVYCRTHAD